MPERWSRLAFIYTNHIVVDEERSRLVFALRDRFGADACTIVPGAVRYRVAGCDRGDWDLPTEANDLRQAADTLTGCYGLDFGPLIEAARIEAPVRYSRPPDPGVSNWHPGTTMASVRFPRNHIRLLTDFEDFTTVDYTAREFEGFPRHASLTATSSGRLTGVIWQQELLHDGHSLWSTETYSPLAQPCMVTPTQRLGLDIGDTWRATNVIPTSSARLRLTEPFQAFCRDCDSSRLVRWEPIDAGCDGREGDRSSADLIGDRQTSTVAMPAPEVRTGEPPIVAWCT